MHTTQVHTQYVELAAKGPGDLVGERAAGRRVGDVSDGAGDAPAARPPLGLAARNVVGVARAEEDLVFLCLVFCVCVVAVEGG